MAQFKICWSDFLSSKELPLLLSVLQNKSLVDRVTLNDRLLESLDATIFDHLVTLANSDSDKLLKIVLSMDNIISYDRLSAYLAELFTGSLSNSNQSSLDIILSHLRTHSTTTSTSISTQCAKFFETAPSSAFKLLTHAWWTSSTSTASTSTFLIDKFSIDALKFVKTQANADSEPLDVLSLLQLANKHGIFAECFECYCTHWRERGPKELIGRLESVVEISNSADFHISGQLLEILSDDRFVNELYFAAVCSHSRPGKGKEKGKGKGGANFVLSDDVEVGCAFGGELLAKIPVKIGALKIALENALAESTQHLVVLKLILQRFVALFRTPKLFPLDIKVGDSFFYQVAQGEWWRNENATDGYIDKFLELTIHTLGADEYDLVKVEEIHQDDWPNVYFTIEGGRQTVSSKLSTHRPPKLAIAESEAIPHLKRVFGEVVRSSTVTIEKCAVLSLLLNVRDSVMLEGKMGIGSVKHDLSKMVETLKNGPDLNSNLARLATFGTGGKWEWNMA